MAKKTKLETGSSFDLDKSLDMPSFDFEVSVPKDDGKPVTALIKGASRGFLSTILSSSTIKSVISSALPRGYGTMIDFADTSARSFKELYDSSIKDIKPQLNEVKRLTGRILPKDATKDTDLLKKIRGYADSYEKPHQQNTADPREANIASVLGSVFDAQQQMDDRRQQVADIKMQLSEGLTHARHKDVIAQLDAIRQEVTKSAAYTTTIQANYHRKSLELQYRHYFLAMDQLMESKRANAITTAALEGILRNTALSEQAKLAGHKDKDKKGFLRNQFLDPMLKTVFARQRDFAKDLVQSLLKQAQGRVKGFTQGVSSGIQGADFALDASDMAEQMGMPLDPYGGAGEFAGAGAGHHVGQWIAKKVRPHLSKSTNVRKGGNKLQYGLENALPLLQEWAQGGDNEKGMMGPFARFLKGSIRGMPGIDKTVQRENISALQEPAVFDRSVSRSITEVIPGLLSRILREQQVLRTGDPKTELTEFDHNSGKFKSQSENRKGLFKSMVTDKAKQWTQDDIERLIKHVGGEHLSAEQKNALGGQLLSDNVNNRGSKASRLSSASSYTGAAAPHGKEFAALFQKHFADDADSAKQYDISSKFNALGRYAQDPRAMVQTLINNGQLEFLQDAGIVDEKGEKIDMEKFYSYFGGGADYKPSVQGVSGPIRGRRGPSAGPSGAPPSPSPMGPMGPAPSAGPTLSPSLGHMPMGRQKAQPRQGQKAQDLSPLMKAIEEASSKSEAEMISETLLRIEDQLMAGIATYGGPEGGGPPDDGRRTVFGHARHFGGKAGRLLGRTAKRMHKTVSGIQNAVIGAIGAPLRFGANLLTKTLGTAANRLMGWRDVYVKGQMVPALKAAGLKAGIYFDQKTGKTLKSWKDIQGVVMERLPDGSVQIALEADQVKDAYIKMSAGEKLISSLGAVGKWSFGKLVGLAGSLSGGLGLAANLGMGAAKLAWRGLKAGLGLIDGPEDVYVKGEKEPALLKRLMIAGAYRDRKSGKTITKPTEITGPVIDDEDNVVISMANLKTGLVDVHGKPFKSLVGKLAGLLGKGLGVGFGVLGSIRTGLGNFAGGVRDFFGGALSAFIGKDGIIFSGGKKIVSELQEIYDLLYARLPENPEFRKGSLEDLRAQRKKKDGDDKRGDKKGDDSSKSPGLLSRLKGLFSRKKKGKGDSEDSDSGGTSIDLGGAGGGAVKEAEKDAAKLAKKVPKTAFGRLAGGLGKVVGGVGKAAVGIGGSLLGVGGGGVLSSLGAAGAGALEVGATVGGGLLTGAGALAGGLATGVAAVGGGLLSAIGAIASAPVLLTGLAIGAAGYGAYKLYKHFTQDNLSTLSKARFVQYGFLPTQTEHVHIVFGIEDIVKDGVEYKNGIAQFNDKKIKFKDALELCGIDLKDKAAVQSWVQWFAKRFKPLYLTAMSALNKIKPNTALGDIDSKLSNAEKKAYFNIAKWTGGPYSELASPIPALKALSAGPDEVKAILDSTQLEMDKQPPDPSEKNEKKKGAAAVAVAASAVTAANKAKDTKKNTDTEKKDDKSWLDKAGAGLASVAGTAWNETKAVAGKVGTAISNATKAVVSTASAVGSAAVATGAAAAKWVGNAASSAASAVGGAASATVGAAKTGVATAGKVISASAAKIKAGFLAAIQAANITNPNEQAMLMAQTDTESGGFKSLVENLNYRPESLMRAFPTRVTSLAMAQQIIAGGPEAIANTVYGGRMGNTAPGDGFLYRGRGIIQLTGKSNYQRYGKMLGIDLVTNPDMASDPDVSGKIALAYMKDRKGLEAAAQRGDVVAATQAVNGGQNGIADRKAKFAMYLQQAQSGTLLKGSGSYPAAAQDKTGGEATKTSSGTGSPAGFGGAAAPAAGGGGAAPGAAGGSTAAGGGSVTAPAGGAPAATASGGTGSPSGFGGSAPTSSPILPSPTSPGSAKPVLAPPAAVQSGPVATGPTVPMSNALADSAATAGGFDPRAMTVKAQDQAQQQAKAGADPVPDILNKQLDQQTQIVALLKQMAQTSGQAAAGPSAPSSTVQPPARPTNSRTPAPVSMRRTTFANQS